ATAALSTSWREGRLYYRFEIGSTPILIAAQARSTRQVGTTRILSAPELRLQFYDKDQFKLVEILLPIPDLVSEVDEHGKQQGLTARDSTECSLQKYQAIRSWNLIWVL